MSRGPSVILHVVVGGAPCPEWVSQALSAAGHSVEMRGSVYSALARIGRSGGSVSNGQAPLKPVTAVLVGVDGLEARAFEFFQLTRRLQPRLPVWVYGRPHSRAKIELALRLGGSAECTLDTLARRLTEVEVPISPITRTTTPSEAMTRGPLGDGCEGPPPAEPKTPGSPVDLPAASVRVPWSRNLAAPSRRGPRREAACQPERGPRAAPIAQDRGEPLLSEAELAALMDRLASPARSRGNRPRS